MEPTAKQSPTVQPTAPTGQPTLERNNPNAVCNSTGVDLSLEHAVATLGGLEGYGLIDASGFVPGTMNDPTQPSALCSWTLSGFAVPTSTTSWLTPTTGVYLFAARGAYANADMSNTSLPTDFRDVASVAIKKRSATTVTLTANVAGALVAGVPYYVRLWVILTSQYAPPDTFTVKLGGTTVYSTVPSTSMQWTPVMTTTPYTMPAGTTTVDLALDVGSNSDTSGIAGGNWSPQALGFAGVEIVTAAPTAAPTPSSHQPTSQPTRDVTPTSGSSSPVYVMPSTPTYYPSPSMTSSGSSSSSSPTPWVMPTPPYAMPTHSHVPTVAVPTSVAFPTYSTPTTATKPLSPSQRPAAKPAPAPPTTVHKPPASAAHQTHHTHHAQQAQHHHHQASDGSGTGFGMVRKHGYTHTSGSVDVAVDVDVKVDVK